jgi:uncharacterized membrane protein YtjA (UPF0391 family)
MNGQARPSQVLISPGWHSICLQFDKAACQAAGRKKFDPHGFQLFLGLRSRRRITMSLLKWALIFLVIAAIAALFGFGGVAQGSEDIAKVLFFIFLVIFAVIGVLGVTVFRKAV